MWWVVGVAAVLGLVALLLFARRSEPHIRRDWELLLSPRTEGVYRTVSEDVAAELNLADVAYEEALALRQLGSIDQAMSLLEAGYHVIERFTPNLLQLLAAMAAFSRMVAAIAPVRPLRPVDFRLAQLASLAQVNRLLHHLLVSAAERFRLKIYVIGRSVALAGRYLIDTTQRVIERRGTAEREWRQIEAIRHDFQALTKESMDSLRALLASLSDERRDAVAGRLRRVSGHLPN